MKTEQVQDKKRHDRSLKVFIVDNPCMNLIFLKQQTPVTAHEMLIWTLDRAIRSTLFNNVKLKLNEMVILDAKAGSWIIKNIWSAREREKKSCTQSVIYKNPIFHLACHCILLLFTGPGLAVTWQYETKWNGSEQIRQAVYTVILCHYKI